MIKLYKSFLDNEHKKITKIAILFVIAVVAGYAAFLVYASYPINKVTIENAALFGDSFGIVNSLFSGFAFIGLIVTVLLQQQELRESREIFRSQKFEDAFYRLLDFYSRNLSNLSINDEEMKPVHKGIGVLINLNSKFNTAIKPYEKFLDNDEGLVAYRYVIFDEAAKILTYQSRYLGSIESILALVSNEAGNNVQTYTKLVASQFTVHELKYLFYRCLVSPTESELVKLVNKTKILYYRLSEIGVNSETIDYYNELHGTELSASPREIYFPFTDEEIIVAKKLKSLLK